MLNKILVELNKFVCNCNLKVYISKIATAFQVWTHIIFERVDVDSNSTFAEEWLDHLLILQVGRLVVAACDVERHLGAEVILARIPLLVLEGRIVRSEQSEVTYAGPNTIVYEELKDPRWKGPM